MTRAERAEKKAALKIELEKEYKEFLPEPNFTRLFRKLNREERERGIIDRGKVIKRYIRAAYVSQIQIDGWIAEGLENKHTREYKAMKKEEKRKQKIIDTYARERKDNSSKEAIEKELKERIQLESAERELYRFNYFMDHGVYPTKKNTDNNVIYMWKHDDMYKIGITSKRRGTKRIYDVAKEGNMHNVEILIYEEVNDALAVESALLQYGTKVKFNHIFDGCTEFRYLNDEERYCVEDIAREYTVNQ